MGDDLRLGAPRVRRLLRGTVLETPSPSSLEEHRARFIEEGMQLRPHQSPVLVWLAVLPVLTLAGCGPTSTESGPLTPGDVYLQEALDILQAHSLHRYELEWAALRAEVVASAGRLEVPVDAYPAIRHALDLIGDEHSRLVSASDTAGSQNSVNMRPRFGLVPDSSDGAPLGYIGVPEAIGRDIDDLALAYHRGIERLDTTGACGWIIDLRHNSGGSMWPMLAGLGPILGEGVLGYYVDADSVGSPWAYEGGASVRDGMAIVQLDNPYVVSSPGPPAAVLVDRFTASSAEGTMISFIGRGETRTIGGGTAGFSTSNRAFTLSDGAILLVTTSVMADRSGRTYGGRVWPDTLAAGDRSLSLVTDQSYRVAVEWLRARERCSD